VVVLGILTDFFNNPTILLLTLTLDVIRFGLEVFEFPFEKLPLTKKMDSAINLSGTSFHKLGLYICIGHFVLFAPEFFFSA